MEIISIINDNTKYSFEKPNFKCELLKVIGKKVIGTIEIEDLDEKKHTILVYWYLECGTVRQFDYFNKIKLDMQHMENTYNLAPMKISQQGPKS